MLNMKISKAKTSFRSQFNKSKKILQIMGNNIILTKIKRHNKLIMSVLEFDDIVLVCRNTLRFVLIGIILLCLFASR
ncbi:hypothetical protein BZZ01_10315 [Nostocales cyanobacterium HT-58-2]|nr:hypothetical protein BZZ01_10315 [Nostocales cyanobacterium HT-58-2]